MKTASIPPIRIEPDFRTEIEAVLHEGESLSQFVEAAVRESVSRRRAQDEFVRRGISAIEDFKRAEAGVPAEAVLDEMQARLDRAKARARQRPGR
jgi:Arc/MetJ-type ribon-helix-helix transcriptional regulator